MAGSPGENASNGKPHQRTLWLGTMKAVVLGLPESPLKNLQAATITMISATAASRSMWRGSCPPWLIFQRIVWALPAKASNQCPKDAVVPGKAAMRVELESAAAELIQRN